MPLKSDETKLLLKTYTQLDPTTKILKTNLLKNED